MTITIQTLAQEVSHAFERARRREDDESTEYVRLKDGSPAWMTELCHHAHGTMFPDDFRYATIEDACDALADESDPDEACLEADIYTNELTGWLASRNDRMEYCDEAMEEFGSDFTSTSNLIALGQQKEKDEVLSLVREWLEERVEQLELEADEEETDPCPLNL